MAGCYTLFANSKRLGIKIPLHPDAVRTSAAARLPDYSTVLT